MVQTHSSTLQWRHMNDTVIFICLRGTGEATDAVFTAVTACRCESNRGPPRWWGLEHQPCNGGVVQPGERIAAREPNSSPSTLARGIKEMQDRIFMQCTAGEWESVDKSSNERLRRDVRRIILFFPMEIAKSQTQRSSSVSDLGAFWTPAG